MVPNPDTMFKKIFRYATMTFIEIFTVLHALEKANYMGTIPQQVAPGTSHTKMENEPY